jgi:uncharacterized membrane protein/mono/diheme cytochrome c family protein
MTRRDLVLIVLGALPTPARPHAQPSTGERDPAAEVRGVFAKRCAGCHGPDLPKPQGRFGYVLDLRRIAGNPEMVIPGRPDQSELWALISQGDMPPADSPRGPLTAAEKEAVRAWIASGAPDVRPATPEVPGSPAEPKGPAIGPPSRTDRAVRLLGKFHLLLMHFPIAQVLAAVVAELLGLRRGTRDPSPVAGFCLLLAAALVVPTVMLGWFHAAGGNGVSGPQLLAAHRWLGTAAGLGVLAAAGCARRDARRGQRSWWGRIALAGAVLLVSVTSHAGGLLAHGRDFFDW